MVTKLVNLKWKTPSLIWDSVYSGPADWKTEHQRDFLMGFNRANKLTSSIGCIVEKPLEIGTWSLSIAVVNQESGYFILTSVPSTGCIRLPTVIHWVCSNQVVTYQKCVVTNEKSAVNKEKEDNCYSFFYLPSSEFEKQKEDEDTATTCRKRLRRLNISLKTTRLYKTSTENMLIFLPKGLRWKLDKYPEHFKERVKDCKMQMAVLEKRLWAYLKKH